jgi:hypothetical protein
MTPRRFLLQIPSASFFYINLAFAMRRAFNRQGIDCHIQQQGLTPDAERALLSTFAPDVILAINGQKSDACREFKNIRYIRWIQDNQFNGADLRQAWRNEPGNDIFYFVSDRQARVFQVGGGHLIGKLRFAAEPVALDAPRPARQSVFSLVGYIPPATLLNASFTLSPNQTFSGMDYFVYLNTVLKDTVEFPLELIDQLLENFFNARQSSTRGIEPRNLALFKEEFIRASSRYRLVKKILDLGYQCRLFGPAEWLTWAELARCYGGEAPTVEQSRAIYQTSAFNLHNGGIIHHPRVFDCMAARGGPILSNRCSVVDDDNEFEPGVHYIEADLGELGEVAQRYLDDPAALQRISDEAHRLIVARHTWDHRVAEILADLQV